MVRNLSNISHLDEEQIFKNLEKDLQKYEKDIERCKKFGIKLPETVDHIKKNVYLYFARIANHKNLAPKTLKWMAEFSESSPYEDIRQNYHNQKWVDQYRELKKGE